MAARHQYEVVDVLGVGGFGRVYLAWRWSDSGMRRLVAVKVLLAEAAEKPDLLARLRDEARLLGLLHHRAIISVYDLVELSIGGEPGVYPAVLLEYVQGADLHSLLRSAGPLPLGPALGLIGEVADALAYALVAPDERGEPLGVLHRDIKPGNIQVTAKGVVKLLDFGIAWGCFKDREALTGENFYGTLSYMAPERLEGVDLPAGDVYSLGVTLVEALAGQLLGRLPSKPGALKRRVGEVLGDLGQRRPDLDEEICDLIASMLEHDPKARPSAAALAARCFALAARVSGPSLRDWSQEVVPSARPGRRTRPAPTVILVESDPSRPAAMAEVELEDSVPLVAPGHAPVGGPAPLARAAVRRRRAGFLLTGALVLLGLGGTWRALGTELVAVPPAASEQVRLETDDGADTAAEHAALPPTDEEAAPAGEVALSAPAPKPERTLPPTRRSEVQGGPTRCSVDVVGAEQVRARGDAGEFLLPGRIPKGRYSLELYAGDRYRSAGELICEAGDVKLVCNSAFAQCSR